MQNFDSTLTCDKTIRKALMENLNEMYKMIPQARIIEELGIIHGAARIDIAVFNGGSIYGYELKSDIDTLMRLPDQMQIYNSVFDKITLVTGKKHIFEAIKIIPDWWGITMAKIKSSDSSLYFCNIREAEQNPSQDSISIASLLWKDEALNILENINKAKGIRSKERKFLYQKLAEEFDKKTLSSKVSEYLLVRSNSRFGIQCIPNGG